MDDAMIFHAIANAQGKESQCQEKENTAQYFRLGQGGHKHHQRKHTPCAKIPADKCRNCFTFEKDGKQSPCPSECAIADKSGKAKRIAFLELKHTGNNLGDTTKGESHAQN